MPSHIYVQTGLWEKSIVANAKAMSSDRSYRLMSPKQGIQNGYMTHNTHMLAFSAMMIGREKRAMAAAQAQWDDLPEEDFAIYAPFFDVVMCSKYDVMKRFGRWDQILAEPEPPAILPNTRAIWRAHRAVSYAAKKDFANAEQEHRLFREAKAAVPVTGAYDPEESGMEFLEVSDLFIAGEIALQKEDWEGAIKLLEEAAVAEDSLGYGEPPLYLQPVRHTLGAVYLKAGKPADAERVYRDDLDQWRDNGWSLYGLSRALEEQGKTVEAAEVKAQFERAWANADAPITTSCMCIPEI
jgi:tetratricopeptide (TPR) repeat protein